MTALELLCATVLATLLMATTLGILTVASRPITTRVATPRWQRAFLEQLRWDLAHARELELSSDGLTLFGYATLLTPTGTPSHQPSAVSYFIEGAGSGRRLVREQKPLDASAAPGPNRSTICYGIGRLELGYPNHRTGGNAARLELHPLRSGRVPEQVVVRVFSVEDVTEPWFQTLLLIR